MTGACLLYLVTFGLVFLFDSISQLTSDVTKSVSVSLNRCFFTCCLPYRIQRKRDKEREILKYLCGSFQVDHNYFKLNHLYLINLRHFCIIDSIPLPLADLPFLR